MRSRIFVLRLLRCGDESGIADAIFRISDDDDNTATVTTNDSGEIRVRLRTCKNYYFTQITAPAEWQPIVRKFVICIFKNGEIYIDECFLCGNTLTLHNTTYVDRRLTIVYSPNGGSGGISEIDLDVGYKYCIKTPEEARLIPPAGKTFAYYSSEPDGSGEIYYPDTTLILRDNLTLYAIWI